MKRNSYIFISLLLSVVLFTSCITEDEYDNSPEGNFEALWQTIDRQYCFLDYKKQEYGLDWNEIYRQYKQRISKGMNNEQLFEVLADMLNELRDGHVNLSSKLEYSQYREWFDSYPANFSDSIQRVYLGKDYAQSSGRVIGMMSMMDAERAVPGWEFGIEIAPDARRRGYAREALQAVMQTYFEKTNAEMFTGGHYAYNLASGKLLKAVGFQYEGVEHKAMRHATRGATDLVCYYIEKG